MANGWQRPGVYLILLAITIMVVMGAFANILTASGFTPPGTNFALTCDNSTGICSNNNPLGCSAGPQYAANCTLQNNNIFGGLLSPTSPFTTLLSGNILGFLSGISASLPIIQNAYVAAGLGTSNIYPGVCTVRYVGNATSGTTWIPTNCSEADQHNNALPPNLALRIAPVASAANQTLIPLSNLGVTNTSQWGPGSPSYGSYAQSFTCLVMIVWATPNASATGGYLDGCQFYSTHAGTTSYWYYTVSYNQTVIATKPISPGINFSYCSNTFGLSQTQCPPTQVPVVLQPESWDVYSCSQQTHKGFMNGAGPHQNLNTGGTSFYWGLTLPPITPQCLSLLQSINAANKNAAGNQIFGVGSVLGFIMGIILLILGTGIGFSFTAPLPTTTTGASASPNPQGTRMAQTLGIGLIVWVPVVSEFSGWLAVFPNGLSIIVAFILSAMVFFGFFAVMLTGTSTTP